MTLEKLAGILNADFHGDPALELHRLSTIEDAREGDVTFVSNKRYEKFLSTTRASAVIVSTQLAVERNDLAILRMKDPYVGFVKCLHVFFTPVKRTERGIHSTAWVDPSATVHPDSFVGANACIGAHSAIGRGTVISEGVVVASNVTIGEECLLYPNVSVIDDTRIGNRVIIHAGTTIGSDGFGFAPVGDSYEKIPQVGFVRIEDDVEIGANCAVDRGALGPTVIHTGTKLDNLIQIAHNVQIGEHTVIAAQSGISGSTVIGRHALIGGQVGIVGHIEIGDDVKIGAQAGISKSLPENGKTYRGSPAREFHEELRLEAAMRQLPELIRTVREQQQRITELEARLSSMNRD